MAVGDISFDGNSLQTANIVTATIKHESMPTKDAEKFALAHANKSTIPFVNYPDKIITVSGSVSSSSITGLDALHDTFMGYLTGRDKNLDIGYGGTTRRYIATVTGSAWDRDEGLAYARFTIEFTCTLPFGKAITATTANTASAVTTSGNNYTATYTGTAPYQQPIITITITSVSNPTGHITVKNNTTGQGITIIGQTFAAADVIVIDTTTRKVTRNGIEIDSIGSFMELAPGSQTLRYEDGFTARQFDITISYTPLYM